MPQEAETCCPLRHEVHQHVNMQGTKKEELLGVCSMSINEKVLSTNEIAKLKAQQSLFDCFCCME